MDELNTMAQVQQTAADFAANAKITLAALASAKVDEEHSHAWFVDSAYCVAHVEALCIMFGKGYVNYQVMQTTLQNIQPLMFQIAALDPAE